MSRDLRRQTKTIREWIKRNHHKQWNSDDLVARIKKNWPTLTQDEVNFVFDTCWPTREELKKQYIA